MRRTKQKTEIKTQIHINKDKSEFQEINLNPAIKGDRSWDV